MIYFTIYSPPDYNIPSLKGNQVRSTLSVHFEASDHHTKQMKVFILIFLALIESSVAIFRTRLKKFTAKTYQDDKLSLNMADKTAHIIDHMGHSIRGTDEKRNQMGGKCQMPCQRESFWMPFAAVMELGNIPNMLQDTIRSKAGNMIDIGKCIGFCRPSQFKLYLNLPVSKHMHVTYLGNNL